MKRTTFSDLLGGAALAKLREVKRKNIETANEIRKVKSRAIGDQFRSLISAVNRAPIPRLDIHYDKSHKLTALVVEGIKYMPDISDNGRIELWDVTTKSRELIEPLTSEQFINRYSWDVDSA